MGRGSSKIGGSGGGGAATAQQTQDAYVQSQVTGLISDVTDSIRLTSQNKAYAVSRLKQLVDPGDQLIEDTGNGQIVYTKTTSRGWVIFGSNMTYQRTDSNIIQDIHDSTLIGNHKWTFKRKG